MYFLSQYRKNATLRWFVRHMAFWVITATVLTYQTYFSGFTADLNIKICLQWLPLGLLVAYTLLYGVLPLLLNRQIGKFILGLVFWGIMIFTGAYFTHYYIVLPLNTGKPLFSSAQLPEHAAFTMIQFVMLIANACVAVSLKLVRYRYLKEKNNQLLIKETMVAELQLLKAQVHPHFLFNTMNNLYSLTLKKSSKAPEIVLKLSELLKYMLTDCNAQEISVEKEIRMIANYIELEKLRYGTELSIDLTIRGNVRGHNIAPLLLIPFVENAFKHGSAEQTGNAFISIDLTISNDKLSFKVINSKSETATARKYGGIGLVNVRKRLQLIYPGQYHIGVLEEKDRYTVEMEIMTTPKTARYNHIATVLIFS